MNRQEIAEKVSGIMRRLLDERGYIDRVDLMLGLGWLTPENHEAWRRGRAPCLERVIHANLARINFVCQRIDADARKDGLKASWTASMRHGKGPRTPLRFSKSGDTRLERVWGTRYLRSQKNPNPANPERLKA